MFSIPNTTINFATYDEDVGRAGNPQTFFPSQLIVGGYVFCSTQPCYVRLTVGAFGTGRKLPEFFLPPGTQGIEVGSEGNPVSKIEVRSGGTSTAPQFWGALMTQYDPLGPFNPASYSVDSTGAIVPPPLIGITWQQDGINKSFEQIANLTAVGGVPWNISDDVANKRTLIPVPPIGVQIADAGQVNEQIIDFQNAGGITWSQADDAANHRTKITGTVTATSSFIVGAQGTGTITVASNVSPGTAILALPSTAYQNKQIRVWFFAERIERTVTSANPNGVRIVLQKDGVTVADPWGRTIAPASVVGGCPFMLCFYDTPTAGNHTYSTFSYAGTANEWLVDGAAPGAPVRLWTEYVI